MRNYKIFAFFFAGIFCVVALISVAFVILLYIYDPLQIYHKPYFRETTFSNDERFQRKAIFKHYDFDSFIFGTSMLQNTLAIEAQQKLKGNWINISGGGATLNQRAITLTYMFKQIKVINIILSLDITHLVVNYEYNTKDFAFLYDDNEINDFKVYLNKKTIYCALKFSTGEDCVGKNKLDNPINWSWGRDTKYKWNIRFGGIQNWLKYPYDFGGSNVDINSNTIETLLTYNPKPFTDSIQPNQKYLEENLLSFVRQYPSVKFSIVIPTYSRLFYRLNSEVEPKAKVILKWLVGESQRLPNMKIYGFDDLDYADDIANYKDLTHYNVDMNSMQLDAIANGTNILTPQNIDSYLSTMESKIKSYDIASLIEQIKAWEAQQN